MSKKQEPMQESTFMQKHKLSLICLLITFIAFIPSLLNDFVLWDDPEYVFNNPFFKDFNFKEVFSFSTYYMGNYHPLTITWMYFESLLFPMNGPEMYNGFNPFWFHLNNLILHLANTWLVFKVTQKITAFKSSIIPLTTALLFGIHPMHVESVAWVSELKDVLYAMFFLLALNSYLDYRQTDKKTLLIASIIFFLLSNLSKAQAVTLPLVLVLVDLFKGRKLNLGFAIDKLPYFAISLFFGLLAVKAQQAESAVNPNYEGLDTVFYGSYGILTYIFKLFIPIGLSGAHPYPVNPVFEELPGYFKILPLGVIALIAAVWKFGKTNKSIWFGAGFFMATISIVLKFVPVGDTIIAERYTYIPYIGLFFILGLIAEKLFEQKPQLKYVGYGITILLVALTWQRNTVWANTITFWEDVNDKYPNYWRGYNCIGQEYDKLGNVDQALVYYTKSCEMDKWAPPIPYMLRGALYVDKLQKYDLAIADFKKVTTFPNNNDPTQVDARHNLALSYFRKGDLNSGLETINQAIQMSPNHPMGHYFQGLILVKGQNYKAAEEAYSKAIQLNPNFAAAYLNRGVLYTDKLKQYAKGYNDFQTILRMQPNHLDAIINSGICLYKQNKLKEALSLYNKSLQLNPNNGRVYYLMALANVQGNDFSGAVANGTKAKQLGMQINDQLLNQWKQQINR